VNPAMLDSLDHAIKRTSTRRGSRQDPNMTTNEQISHELRANLYRVITTPRPYAQSSGPFHPANQLFVRVRLTVPTLTPPDLAGMDEMGGPEKL
jgi:hypothetical protein